MLGVGRDPRVRLAERLAESYGAREVRLTDSGTTALRLAISGSLAVRGGFIALPAYACYDLATAAIGAGATVRLYDVEAETLEPEPGSLERLIHEGASAVVVAHLFGQPACVDRIAELCRAAECTLIEDAAQEAGGRIGGRRLGSFGSVSILSFGRGKGMTGGSGGALLVHDDRGAAGLRAADGLAGGTLGVSDLLVAAGLWALARPAWYWLPRTLPGVELGRTVYKEPTRPRGMSRAAAAIVGAALELLEAEVDARRRNAARLRTAVAEGGGIRVAGTRRQGVQAGWLRMPVLLDREAREVASRPEAASLGIARSYPLPLQKVAALQSALISTETFPGAERLAVELYTVPTHGGLAARDMQKLAAWLEASGRHGSAEREA